MARLADQYGNIKILGSGSVGGKGEGLIRINECPLPRAYKLRTWILATSFYERFLERDGRLADKDLAVAAGILEEIGDTPIGVRSSATNEAVITEDGFGPIHAGENTTFMLPNNHPDVSTRLSQMMQAPPGRAMRTGTRWRLS